MLMAVCDPDEGFYNKLKTFILNGAIPFGTNPDIMHYQNSTEFWEGCGDGNSFMAVFIDINLGNDNGFDLGQSIKEYSKDTYIIFVTNNLEYTIRSYSIPAFGYISKIDMKKYIYQCITRLFNDYYVGNQILYPAITGAKKTTKANSIEYIIKTQSTTELYFVGTERKTMATSILLDTLEEMLRPFNFIRIHRDCIVNSIYIDKLVNKRVTMKSGIKIPVNRCDYALIREQYELS